MTIYETILSTYPELEGADLFALGIMLQDDLDGQGAFIVHWEYSKPIPDGLKLGK
jgi:hypothetical protein